jgi:hypothetical protein
MSRRWTSHNPELEQTNRDIQHIVDVIRSAYKKLPEGSYTTDDVQKAVRKAVDKYLEYHKERPRGGGTRKKRGKRGGKKGTRKRR